ncbi:5-oxoprolinase/urea amidolyase family protein [Gordonia jinhuaensis]|uniref:Carboxyltransferase domain-containing protein n=1 Tax=Gordonia jinhuaensis TaxID=1517702 RepID=A0A916TAW8_9ACTN|nr:biotin-dependent carboxyltransferase family protein [Gordonia jinhuaensis]GGB37896.1 hypothetical protein GCM10011489_27100 [Gordonia jinhuaensis]
MSAGDPAIPHGALTVVRSGPLTTVQDLGRPGYAHLGVGASGAADRGALRLANRLVGNPESAAALEVTMGGLVVRATGTHLVAVTGAPTSYLIDDTRSMSQSSAILRAGQTLTVEPPTTGLRSYVAVRGGIDVAPVLGSRSTDLLSGIGPARVAESDLLPVGPTAGDWPSLTFAPGDGTGTPAQLVAELGPRDDRIEDPHALFTGSWVVSPASDRIGIRLDRGDDTPVLRHRSGLGDLPSEGVALGSVQIPPGGQPVIFLADHPVTGGYPVVAVITASSVDTAAQLVPGEVIRFVERR